MTMTRRGHHRLEDFNRFLVGNASALEHEPNGKIAFDQQVRLGELGGEMKVAHLPCPVSGFLLVGIRHTKDLFGLLIYNVVPVLLGMKTNSVPEGRFQIETKVGPVLRLPSPSTLGQNSPFH